MKATIILVGAIQGFLIALGLIFKKSKNRQSNTYLSLLILVFSLELLFTWGSLTGYNNQKDKIPFWLLNSYLLMPPALWLFFKHNSEINFKFSSQHRLLFIPALIDIVVSTIRYSSSGTLLAFSKSPLWFFFIDTLPLLLIILILVIQGMRLARIFKTQRQSSNREHVSHFMKLLSVFLVFCFVGIIWIAEGYFLLPVQWVFDTCAVFLLFSLAYISFFNPSFFEIPKIYQNKKSEEFKNYNDAKEFDRLNDLFRNNIIYMQPKLSLNDLADELKLPSKYISYLINTYTSSNFNDFVNSFRVKEVLRKIPLEKQKNLLGIALDSGFNSKSAFNQAFKQHTGKTPSAFLK